MGGPEGPGPGEKHKALDGAGPDPGVTQHVSIFRQEVNFEVTRDSRLPGPLPGYSQILSGFQPSTSQYKPTDSSRSF